MSTFEDIIAREGHLVYTNVGKSMMPLLRQGRDLMVIVPKPDSRLKRYDIPLYKRDDGKYILHRILKARPDDYVLCGDNQWHRETGITDLHIIGVLQAVVRDGKTIPVTDWRMKLYAHLWCDLFPVRALVFRIRDLNRRIGQILRRGSLPEMTSAERDFFFGVLQESLWGKPVNSIPDGIRWDVVVKQFKYQTVMGLAAFPMIRLMNQGLVPYTYMNDFVQRIGLNTRQHPELNSHVIEVFHLLGQEGFHPVLLKGQGVAQSYPNPVLRMCGDIDVYIGRKDYQRAISFFSRFGDAGKATYSPKHYHINYGDTTVELHRVAEVQHLWGTNGYYRHLTEKWLEETPSDYVSIEGEKIPVPPGQFNVLYVFNHLWHHFVTRGLGIRQLCDWAVVLHHAYGKIDENLLLKHLKRLRLLNSWRDMGWIVVNCLGLPSQEMPFYTDKAGAKARRIWQLLERMGTFGKYNYGPSIKHMNKWKRKPLSFLRHVQHFQDNLSIAPIDAVCVLIHLFFKGLLGLFKSDR